MGFRDSTQAADADQPDQNWQDLVSKSKGLLFGCGLDMKIPHTEQRTVSKICRRPVFRSTNDHVNWRLSASCLCSSLFLTVAGAVRMRSRCSSRQCLVAIRNGNDRKKHTNNTEGVFKLIFKETRHMTQSHFEHRLSILRMRESRPSGWLNN